MHIDEGSPLSECEPLLRVNSHEGREKTNLHISKGMKKNEKSCKDMQRGITINFDQFIVLLVFVMWCDARRNFACLKTPRGGIVSFIATPGTHPTPRHLHMPHKFSARNIFSVCFALSYQYLIDIKGNLFLPCALWASSNKSNEKSDQLLFLLRRFKAGLNVDQRGENVKVAVELESAKIIFNFFASFMVQRGAGAK